MLCMVKFTINIPQMLAYINIPCMDPMGYRFRYQICQPGAANYAPQTAQPKKPPGQGPF